MLNLELLLRNQNQLAKNYKPQIIQLYFNGIEVMRIENGEKIYEMLVPDNFEPELIEMSWDKEIVYALKIPKQSINDSLQQPDVFINRLLLVINGG